MRKFAISGLIVLLAAPALFAQQPPATEQQPAYGERVEVNAVLIDAVVTDPQGNQILGLDKNDFVITENGVPQPVDSLDYFTSRKLLNATEQNAPFKVEQVHESRYLVFFFDKPESGALFGRLANARRDVERFLDKQMTATDKVAIVGHDVRLKVYSDFTSDKTQIRKAIEDVAQYGRGLTSPAANATTESILKNIDRKAMIDRTGTVYEAVTELADALRPIRARKNLVVFSAGIREIGEDVRDGVILNRSRYYQPMIDALNAANVTVYTMNLQENAPPEPVFHQTLESMARETNGEYYRYAVTYSNPLSQVAKASAGYYLLSYRTEKKGRGFQKVDVSIRNHPEFHVTARAGYAYGD